MVDLTMMTSTVKYLMLFFNFLFVITGIIFISVGATVQAEYEAYTHFLDTPYSSIPAFLIAIGVLIFLIAIFGCYGGMKENYMMILGFSILMIVMFILELSAGISGYVLRDRTAAVLEKEMMSSLTKYPGDKDLTSTWDYIQNNFQCCGVNKYDDWAGKIVNASEFNLPISCCNLPSGTVGTFHCNYDDKKPDIKNLYKEGCAAYLVKLVKSHAGSLGATGIILSIIQFIGIIFSCQLARRTKYEVAS